MQSNQYWRRLGGLQQLIFRVVWPLTARLPKSIGVRIASWIGLGLYALDMDWRSIALRHNYVKDKTLKAAKMLLPESSDTLTHSVAKSRFKAACVEELQGHWIAYDHLGDVELVIENKETFDAICDKRLGACLLTFHFDSTLLGVSLLGRAGLATNLMTSNVVEHPSVSACVQTYFKNKYAGIDRYLNGGTAAYVETHLRRFYADVKAGLSIVILGEAPASKVEEATPITFANQRLAFAPGFMRIAERTRAPIAAFVCIRDGAKKYRVIFTPLYAYSDATGHTDNVQALYSFLEAQIRQRPGRWWAADQLPNFLTVAHDGNESDGYQVTSGQSRDTCDS